MVSSWCFLIPRVLGERCWILCSTTRLRRCDGYHDGGAIIGQSQLQAPRVVAATVGLSDRRLWSRAERNALQEGTFLHA
jgi:hypothetical protein